MHNKVTEMSGLLVFMMPFLSVHAGSVPITINSAFGSKTNPLKVEKSVNAAIDGAPIGQTTAKNHMQCTYICRKHLSCRSSTYFTNNTCALHSKQSNKGLILLPGAISSAFMDSGDTQILLFHSHKLYEFIPETGIVTTLTNQVPGVTNITYIAGALGIYGNKMLAGPAVNRKDMYLSTGIPLNFTLTKPIPGLGRTHGAVTVVQGVLYICMGMEPGDTSGTNTCIQYDFDMEQWTSFLLTGSPPKRYFVASVGIDNNLYVAGGRAAAGVVYKTFGRINLINRNYLALAEQPTALMGSSAVHFGNFIVVCGGALTYNTNSVTTCNKYNLETGVWQGFPNILYKAFYPSLILWKNTMILSFGGRDRDAGVMKDRIDVYKAGAWSNLAKLPFGMFSIGVINIDD